MKDREEKKLIWGKDNLVKFDGEGKEKLKKVKDSFL